MLSGKETFCPTQGMSSGNVMSQTNKIGMLVYIQW